MRRKINNHRAADWFSRSTIYFSASAAMILLVQDGGIGIIFAVALAWVVLKNID